MGKTREVLNIIFLYIAFILKRATSTNINIYI